MTPSPIPLSEYQQQYPSNGTALKVYAAAVTTALLGMTVAWATALREKGVTYEEMARYVTVEDTPINFNVRENGLKVSAQAELIEKHSQRLDTMDAQHVIDAHDQGIQTQKITEAANALESLRGKR